MRLIAAFLLFAIPVSAKPTVLHLRWIELQTVAESSGFRKKVTVRTGPDGRSRTRGSLESINETGLVLGKRNGLTTVRRTDVHSVRLGRKRGNSYIWRTIAIAGSFPLWLIGLSVGLAIPGGIPEGRWWKMDRTPQGVASSIALPAGIYWLAHRADMKRRDIIVKLKRGREDPP